MRRVRLTFTVISLACSLLLCGLWVRSYWRGIDVEYIAAPHTADRLVVICGVVDLSFARTTDNASTFWHVDYLDAIDVDDAQFPRFWLDRSSQGQEWRWTIDFPIWLPAAITAVPPLVWAWRRRRLRGRGFPIVIDPEHPAGT